MSLGRSKSIALVGSILVAGLLSGCTSGGQSDLTGSDVPGVTHIHGLGVNPADGELYAASHYGVFRIEGGDAVRMGGLIQDTMGFTVAGPDRFLGSGHPDLRNDTVLTEGMRPLLGLIESTDRAETWQARSLQGEVDFHALASSRELVYGYDGTRGQLLVSSDMRTWEPRATEPLLSIAVSIQSPDELVGTTEVGPIRSSDGGRTWGPITGAPPLALVSWDQDAGLWGVTADGAVHSSSDDGTTWARRGLITGQPAAFLAHSSGIYLATSSAILQSTDQGETWKTLYEMRG